MTNDSVKTKMIASLIERGIEMNRHRMPVSVISSLEALQHHLERQPHKDKAVFNLLVEAILMTHKQQSEVIAELLCHHDKDIDHQVVLQASVLLRDFLQNRSIIEETGGKSIG